MKKLERSASTDSPSEFALMCKSFDRVNIVAEGDSWFDYPKKYIVAGRSANVIDHIEKWTRGKANLLRLATNGDEATQILSGPQRHKLCRVLDGARKRGKPVDVLLFSGGGNDIVGKWDMPRFLRKFRPKYSAAQCIDAAQLKSKMDQVALAHVELMNIRNHYSPGTVIITHNYDRVFPSDKGAKLLGHQVTQAWLKPHMDEAGIPASLQDDVADLFMERMSAVLMKLPARPEAKGKYFVVNTMGTLTSKSQWLNEIHPTSAGFKKIAQKVYAKVRSVEPHLPAPRG